MARRISVIIREVFNYCAFVALVALLTCLFLWAGWLLFIMWLLDPAAQQLIGGTLALAFIGGGYIWLAIRTGN